MIQAVLRMVAVWLGVLFLGLALWTILQYILIYADPAKWLLG